SSTIITKSPAGNDTMPWKPVAAQVTEVGVIYPPVANAGTNAPPIVSAGANQNITANIVTGDPKLTSNTCASPPASPSPADPFITTFSVTVKPGDSLLSVVVGYRAAGKTIAGVVFNGNQNLIKSAGTLNNTMGAEIWSLKNPAATTGNVVITY